ncbi:hypothetical protein FHL15_007743 [Xylaria flabelliformis]|uniref:Uncharacterized protein n=1 Tax=Xylaria flabelliformis TaxID=2512241 RepID=A0A553HTR0_9PEZI|nr:hypothetical protein FHL15_007743 [Xylaria flabelliformis]
MCFLPCWPVRDIVLEDEPNTPMFQYVWNGSNWVPTIGDQLRNTYLPTYLPTQRVSFAASESPNITKPVSNIRPTPTSNPVTSNNTGPAPRTRPASSDTCPPPHTAGPATDKLAGIFTHTVTNTPQGLVVDGVLRPRGTAHSDLRDALPQPFPNSSIPLYFHNTADPQVNMSTVGAGLMPDPYAAHYQPPVPDTTNGPFQHTYVPRADAYGPQYMMPNGVAAPGGPPFCAPPAFPCQQPQPGMATAPIPMMAPGSQPPFMQPYPMQGPPMNLQPGSMPPMAAAPVPGGPVYVATGIGHPTPPMTPPSAHFVGGNYGGFEMGKTKNELDAETRYNAQHNQMNEPQGIKPADDDISRMYWCRELDGQWVSRSRFSLDRMGNFRWYVSPDGVFYAKMLVE